MKIKISIIIPVYNAENFLRKCIMSVLKQSLKEIEIIIINDGSTDKSLEILKEFLKMDSRIILIDKKNEGVSTARNCGLSIAKGEYVLNIDSDDYIEYNYCEEMYNAAKNFNLDILISDYYYSTKEKNIYKIDLKIDENKILTGEEYLEIFFKENFKGFNWNKLLKKDLFEKSEIKYGKNLSMMEDTLIIVMLSKNAKKIGKLNKAYYYYCQHTNNSTRNIKIKHILSVMKVFRNIKHLLLENRNINHLVREREIVSTLGMILLCNDKNKINLIIKIFLLKIKEVNKINLILSKNERIKFYFLKFFPYSISIYILKLIFDLKN